MLTSRGWWFLVIVLALLTLGVFGNLSTVALLALTLVLWFFAEWLLFAVRIHFVIPTIRVVREVRDERGPVDSLWSGRLFQIRLTIDCSDGLGLPYVRVTDWTPF